MVHIKLKTAGVFFSGRPAMASWQEMVESEKRGIGMKTGWSLPIIVERVGGPRD